MNISGILSSLSLSINEKKDMHCIRRGADFLYERDWSEREGE
jgi:hypothetical protein